MNSIVNLLRENAAKETRRSWAQTRVSGQDRSSPPGRRSSREILLLCATANILPGRKERISQILAGTIDWRYLLDLAKFHDVAPLIAHNLVNNGLGNLVPQPCLERLKQIYNSTLYRNILLSDELTRVLAVFRQHGIAAIVLKGTTLAEQLYGNPALRTVVDIDIMVRPGELSSASSLLVEMGYEQLVPPQTWYHSFHKAPYRKQRKFPVFIELHWDLEDRRLVAIPQQDIWNRAQWLKLPGGNIMVLSPEDTLLFLSNNFSKQGGRKLRSVCDIAELIKKYDRVLNWDYIVKSSKSWNIEVALYYSLRWAHDLLGAPVPISSVRALKPGVWRRCLLGLLMNQEFFISSIRLDKLRAETYIVARSLMMKHGRQMLEVLSRYRDAEKGAKWLRTASWVILVFGAALARNTIRAILGWRSTHSVNIYRIDS